jgi:hypothetical protein
MNGHWFLPSVILALCCLAFSDAHGADRAATSDLGAISAKQYAKLKPGLSKAQVKSLLGAPWRTIQYNDLDELEDEIWEYRGADANGSYRVHIEFDHHDVVRIVGKIPDNVPGGKGTPAQS